MNKFLAFTLAETLIVMGIIGIVAALTLPNLNNSTGEKEKIAKVKKIYSNLQDAYGRAIAIYGKDSFATNPLIAGERLSDFLKITKTCGLSNQANCFAKYNNYDLDMYTIILADGTSVGILPCEIYIDIDGPNKGPNTAGKDVFAFHLNVDEVTPYGSIDFSNTLLTSGCFTQKGIECTAWVVNMENMDYLKCADKLNANNLSCK